MKYSSNIKTEDWNDSIAIDSDDSSDNITIYLDDIDISSTLSYQLKQFGYNTTIINNFDQLKNNVSLQRPRVIIIGDQLKEGKGALLLKSVQNANNPIPTIFLANDNQIETHLEAVNAGGVALINKAYELTTLLDKLDNLVSRFPEAPYRILVVDDSESTAIYYSNILRSNNMDTQFITNPLDIMPVLTDFTPDLILMDMYMPQCNGTDLAKVIRQRDAYNSIPIVFLSSEDDIDKQLATMDLGADDFINKNIIARRLVTSISARIKRARKLRSLMMRDSLTNLLNHSSTKLQLETEIKRARRTGDNLCFAMIDIDHFKKVNDTYGHLTGDRVIKQLARLLQQRLRSTDIVGRYGGEEFAVIMPDTNITSAYSVMNELRLSFEAISHQAENTSFHTTFSCGIADFRSFPDATSLNDSADKMLYLAKSKGRNCVVSNNH